MKQTSNLFSEYFSSVYTNHTNDLHLPNTVNIDTYFDITNDDIVKAILALKEIQTNSPDGVPSIFYKKTIENMKTPLTILFKKSLVSMCYPSKWKTSFITPILKSGDSTNVENYRPISILSAISKIYDKLILKHIQTKTSHLLATEQHGFTMGKSTLSNLLEFTNYVTSNISGGGQIDTVYMDLAKAFDRIDHSILLSKLSRMPLDPCIIKLLNSYLTNRRQLVCVGGERSSPITPKSSVPQGSILSPLLFALFINDLPPLIKSKILLFADDLKLFLKINDHSDARQLQKDIDTIFTWCNDNNLQLNIQKCHIVSFTRRQQTTFQYFNYNINHTSLGRKNVMKDLGITFDSKLTFESHINQIVKKAYKMLGFISRSLNKFKNISTYKILYYTYVRSCLEYGSSVWNPHYEIYVKLIERVQRRFTRTIYRKFSYPSEKHYEMRYARLELISLENRRKITDELALYKIYRGIIKTELINVIQHNRPLRITRYNTNNIFYLPFVNSNVEYYGPMQRLQRQHDSIFHNVDLNVNTLASFKRYIHHEIINNEYRFDYSFE